MLSIVNLSLISNLNKKKKHNFIVSYFLLYTYLIITFSSDCLILMYFVFWAVILLISTIHNFNCVTFIICKKR